MSLLRRLVTWCIAAGALAIATSVFAGDDLVLKGDAACTACHDDADGPELLAIGKTRHGTQADARTPSCTSCHGASKDHLVYKGSGKRPHPDVTFGAKSVATSDARNGACQDCHSRDSKRNHWDGSTHQARDVTCAACHKVHAAKDPVRSKVTQSEVCFACHKEQRSLVNKPSHHPVLEGKVACSDCHNPHGSTGPSLMKRNSVVETCYTCHMEKRGPVVHSHQPVTEDCSICHNPHGTTTESLLKSRPPFLCNSCHTPHGPIQPAVTTGVAPANAVPGWWNPTVITQGKSCMSCHSQIHGSNNPTSAGKRFFR